MTSPPGWIPGLVPFRIPDDIPDDVPDGAPDDAPDAVLPTSGQKYRLHKIILNPCQVLQNDHSD